MPKLIENMFWSSLPLHHSLVGSLALQSKQIERIDFVRFSYGTMVQTRRTECFMH